VKSMGNITKFVVAVAGTITTALVTQYPSTNHWVPEVVSAITALLVYFVPNTKN